MVSRTVSFAKMIGFSGVKIIQAQPFLLVILPTVGAMFFHGCGSIFGNNTVRRACNSIGNILNLPMAYCKSVYNAYVLLLFNRTLGITTIATH